MPRRRPQQDEEEEENENHDDEEHHDHKDEADDDNDDGGGGVLDQSGLTEEERRQVRKQQRQLLKDIEEKGDALEVDEARGRNNQIYKKVRYTREAVLDGENLISIASKASQKVDRLIQVRRRVHA